MLNQICESDDADLCKQILAVVSTVYRPITLMETTSTIETLGNIADDYKSLAALIGLSGSFLSLREDTVSFVHQSANDFLMKKASKEIFPQGIDDIHHTIFLRSVLATSQTHLDVIYTAYALPEFPSINSSSPIWIPSPLFGYSCIYWVNVLLDCQTKEDMNPDLKGSGSVYNFLR